MAFFSLHGYDADVWIPQFLGLQQHDESLNTDVRYATEVLNVETPNGVLQPHSGYTLLPGQFEGKKIETLARFYRRWYDGSGSKYWLVCAVDGKLYYMQEGAVSWTEIPLLSSFDSNVWSWCTYERAVDGVDHPVDVLLMSNAEDGMIEVDPPEKPTTWGDVKTGYTWGTLKTKTWGQVRSEAWSIDTSISTGGYKFGVIERYAERIWGGAIKEYPDRLVYSAEYNPKDWTENATYPEKGSGEIDQPSWDGDKFTALRSFGGQLSAFKGRRVWRVYGTNPGEYTFTEQYGGGAPFFNTICVDVERIIMADVDGLSVYDGMSVQPFARKLIDPLWRKINKNAMDQMCAALFKNKYYLAVPMGTSTVKNALIVLNLEENTILYYDDMNIESLMATENNIYATSSTVPGVIYDLGYDSWVLEKASGGATKWVSPWMDFGHKKVQKGGFDMYICPEVKDDPVTLKISIQTEKKTKTKEYTVNPLTAEQREAHKEHKFKKLHFGGTGRRFRVIIETASGNTAPWRLIGGLQMVVETDPD